MPTNDAPHTWPEQDPFLEYVLRTGLFGRIRKQLFGTRDNPVPRDPSDIEPPDNAGYRLVQDWAGTWGIPESLQFGEWCFRSDISLTRVTRQIRTCMSDLNFSPPLTHRQIASAYLRTCERISDLWSDSADQIFAEEIAWRRYRTGQSRIESRTAPLIQEADLNQAWPDAVDVIRPGESLGPHFHLRVHLRTPDTSAGDQNIGFVQGMAQSATAIRIPTWRHKLPVRYWHDLFEASVFKAILLSEDLSEEERLAFEGKLYVNDALQKLDERYLSMEGARFAQPVWELTGCGVSHGALKAVMSQIVRPAVGLACRQFLWVGADGMIASASRWLRSSNSHEQRVAIALVSKVSTRLGPGGIPESLVHAAQAFCEALGPAEPEPKSMQARIRNAVRLAVAATEQAESGMDLALTIAAVEALVCQKSQNVADELARNVAAILVSNADDRKQAIVRVKALYNTRSRVLHGEKIHASEWDAQEARVLLLGLLRAAIEWRRMRSRLGLNEEQFSDWINAIDDCVVTGKSLVGVPDGSEAWIPVSEADARTEWLGVLKDAKKKHLDEDAC